LGTLMALVGLMAVWLRFRGTLYDARWIQHVTLYMGPSGFIAVLAGWMVTEVGRQPYTIYGLLRTSESLAPVDAPAVAASLIAFIVVYFVLFGAGTMYILRMMSIVPDGQGPQPGAPMRASGITPAASMHDSVDRKEPRYA
ncbi:MAG: cytochrome ubiquinol oxidase subunit I, partial [Congregibacter sp.]|nr:cytochrome ubiquinol oxidase subunit I [Congregibacter sp.]